MAQVVGPVTDGDGLRQRHAGRLRELAQRRGLPSLVDDRLKDPAGPACRPVTSRTFAAT